jgi:hypothetical protein
METPGSVLKLAVITVTSLFATDSKIPTRNKALYRTISEEVDRDTTHRGANSTYMAVQNVVISFNRTILEFINQLNLILWP